MNNRRDLGLLGVLGWLLFPAVPVVLENAYSGVSHLYAFGLNSFPDPRDWSWLTWLVELGPLLGFGFLVGATPRLPDDPSRRGLRALLGRRAVWVAIGPWSGLLAWGLALWCYATIRDWLPNHPFDWISQTFEPWQGTWVASVAFWMAFVFVVVTLSYAWLLPAWATIRRARRLGQGWESIRRGMTVSAAFVGSLFGSFWAVTEWWRTFFFDPRIAPLVLAGATLLILSGCGSPVSYGEVRRRELFHAMLLAWTLGLALLWRWRARSGKKPPE